jgi:CBS domain-containing protein
MRCQEIMKKDVECVLPTDTVQAAAKRMRDENIGFLPICDESRKVLGTITDRDLTIRVLADAGPSTTRVQEVMTQQVVSCQPEDDVADAEKLMSKNQKSRIVCVDPAGRLVGVISLSDLAQIDDAEASRTLREVSEREARA